MTIDTATAKPYAWQKGCQDYLAGVHSNPFNHESQPIHHREWWCGYSAAQGEYERDQQQEPSHA